MALLDDVKTALGISHNAKNTDIANTINTAKRQLELAGIHQQAANDSYYNAAIITYCKSVYDYQGDAERWEARFNQMMNQMALAEEYHED